MRTAPINDFWAATPFALNCCFAEMTLCGGSLFW